MSSADARQQLRQDLFDDSELNAYAILDGASVPALQEWLTNDGLLHRCLYTGNLAPDLREVAPYVVRLDEETEFTDWVIDQGWSKHWGIFALSEVDINQMRIHLRKLLVVQDPDGRSLIFRYYDPRVLRVFMPTCDKGQRATMFGPVAQFLLEGEQPGELIRFLPQAVTEN